MESQEVLIWAWDGAEWRKVAVTALGYLRIVKG